VENLPSKGYELLLEALSEDKENREMEYFNLREKLAFYFTKEDRKRWNADYAYLADDTLFRVSQNLADGKKIEVNIRAYIRGVARFVWLEFIKKNPLPNPEPLPEPPAPPIILVDEDERIFCLRECLNKIIKNEEERKLIIAYYNQNDNDEKLKEVRKKIAEDFGLTKNNLSTKMCRLRESMKICILNCMKSRK
jgi:hypothetical protein